MTDSFWKTVQDGHPPRHAQYAVVRDGRVFTATPCYGMHAPWWVVRTMADGWPNEADPVPMKPDDLWMPVAEFVGLEQRIKALERGLEMTAHERDVAEAELRDRESCAQDV